MSRSALLRLYVDRLHRIAEAPHRRAENRMAAGAIGLVLALLLALSLGGGARVAHADPLDAAMGAALGATCFGSIGMTDSVPARAMESWEVCLEPGRLARVEVVGDGATKLDCDLYGPDGRVKTYTSGTRCDFRWRVKQRGNHRLEVRNRGEATNVYALTVQ